MLAEESTSKKSLFYNSVCLILTSKDAKNIKSMNYERLSFGLQEIIFALSNNKNIHEITIGEIHNNNRFQSFQLKSIFKSLITKLSHSIDNLDFILNKYNHLTSKKLNKKSFNNFTNKVKRYIFLDQTNHQLYSYTALKESFYSSYKFDFFIRGSGLRIERGELLNKYSTFGILSLHHGDNRINRGSPAGFWEIYLMEKSGITAQFLTDELDGGEVIYIASLKTIPNPKANLLNIYANSAAVLEVAFNKIYNSFEATQGKKTQSFIISPYFRKIFRSPNSSQRLLVSICCLFKTVKKLPMRILKKIVSINLNPNEKWGVAFTSNKNQRFSKWNQLTVNLTQDWYADPFFAFVENKLFLLTEKFIYNQKKGVIFSTPIDFKKGRYVAGVGEKLLENDFHLSYPFTFQRENNTYLIPENNKNGCWLYKLELKNVGSKEFLSAKKVKHLISGHAIDPTLIRYEGFDYLFVSGLIYNSQFVLNVFISSNILTEELKLHPQSPICVDTNLGRSAGRIFVDQKTKKIIRPSQICENSYGEGILFSELEISPKKIEIKQSFHEILTPQTHSDFKKVHHIDKFQELYAMDFVKK